jgi:hypothetical protein
MSYTALEIQQALATADSKLELAVTSSFLRRLYGMYQNCEESTARALSLLRFALSKWDHREGATNAYTEAQLGNIIRGIHKL